MECKDNQKYSGSTAPIAAEIIADVEKSNNFGKKQVKDEMSSSETKCCKKTCCCAPCIALSKYSWKTLAMMFAVFAVMLITIEMAADTTFCYFNPVVPLDIIPMSTPRDPKSPHKEFAITFLGDSMLLDAQEKFFLTKKIHQFLPDYKFNMTVHANNAVRVKNVRERLANGVYTQENPDGYIIMADSDITDVPISIYSQKKQLDLLSNYSRTLVHVIEHITALNKWVALASPCGVLLEAPYFSPPKSGRFHEKEHYLNSYITATRLVAEKMNVPYIDIRTPSLQAIPIYRVGYKGCVTRDGEHANDYGTIIMANKFSEVINAWLSSVTIAKPPPGTKIPKSKSRKEVEIKELQ